MDAVRMRGVAGSMGAESGGALTVTHPPRIDMSDVPNRLTGGEDWFEVMIYLRWDPDRLRAVSEHLDAVKEATADGKSDGWTQSVPGSGGLWKVEPTGCRLGKGNRGPIMRWRMARDGIVFGLTHRPEPHKSLPSGFVRMTGDVLIALGDARAMWDQVVAWFSEIGATVTCAKVSRVDMCVDLPGVDVAEFVELYHRDQYITRTKRANEFSEHPEWDDEGEDDNPTERLLKCPSEVFRAGRRYTGLRMGCGTQLRIYDKLAECRDLALRAWLAKRRWGGSVPDAATRVEFQLRRSFLTAEKCKPTEGTLDRPVIDTVEDYFEHRAAMARYLCRQWVCFFSDGFDRRRPDRADVAAIWQRVADDFEAWAGRAARRRYEPLTREEVPVSDLIRQAKGCIESAAARCGMVVDTNDDLYYFALEQLGPEIDDDAEVPIKVERKMKHLIRPVDLAVPIPF